MATGRPNAPNAWRKRAARNMPALATRIFALRDKMYQGCGFHWCMERDLGRLIARLNDYDSPFDAAQRLGTEVALEMLYREVKGAEETARLVVIKT